MEYLDHSQILARKAAIQESFETLLASRIVAGRPGAKQWRFFRACLARLLEDVDSDPDDFAGLARVTAAQYKFEIEDKLRRFYRRPGKRQEFVFSLVHASRLHWYGLSSETYPLLAGYGLLVRQLDAADPVPGVGELHAYLEKVIARSMEAEFQVYDALPRIDLTPLDRWFVKDGPAMREIIEVTMGCARRGWHLSSPMNPSTCRLLMIKVKDITGKEAVVTTRQYWYLRWFDQHTKQYTYPYRETSQQVYILQKSGDRWLVYQNLRPLPRSSQPLRWNRRQ